MYKYVVCIVLMLAGCGGTSAPTAPATLSSIAISPDPALIGIGTTLSLTATGTYSNATTADISSQVSWKSAAPTTASVGPTGIVSLGASVARGNTTKITATLNGVTSPEVIVTVTAGGSTSSAILNTGRYDHTATLLPDGTVLVAGGYNNATLASAELYDPAKKLWTTIKNMFAPRRDHTAILLATGQVQLIGGGEVHDLDSVESYTPSTGDWTLFPGVLTTPRSYHTSTLLNNPANIAVNGGKELVLVVGGGIGSTSDLYDPSNLAASAVAVADTSPRYSQTATLLNDGKVLVAGGFDYATSTTLATAVLYDASGRVMSPTGSLATARYSHTATLLNDGSGRVLVAGGTDPKGQALATAELFDPSTGQWSPTNGSLAFARSGHIATLMPDGKVLVMGGEVNGAVLSSAELYDPGTGTWSGAANLQKGRYVFSATMLNDGTGRVLVVGGLGASGALSDVELHN